MLIYIYKLDYQWLTLREYFAWHGFIHKHSKCQFSFTTEGKYSNYEIIHPSKISISLPYTILCQINCILISRYLVRYTKTLKFENIIVGLDIVLKWNVVFEAIFAFLSFAICM